MQVFESEIKMQERTMPSPFPGMDPYIERPEIWPDFHDSLIGAVKAVLQPQLRPRYVALGRDRLYVIESDRPIYPDLSIIRTKAAKTSAPSAVAVVETDVPAVFELWREELREPFIEIIEPAAGNRVVTAIEVLSPDNKRPGPGRRSYLEKREEYWAGGANLVEIDLLREGDPTVRVTAEKLEALRPWHYLVTVTRRWPPQHEVHTVSLKQRLPRVAIPLGQEDKDVALDLQGAFSRTWEEGPYPELLHYEAPPLGSLSAEDLAWCETALQAAGFRPIPPAPPALS
jgi:Protein of unknown function (DUF4058)